MRFLVLVVALLISACGGGGAGNTPNGDLRVGFTGYPTSFATSYKAVSFAPEITDLNGNRPTYRVSSGSLPSGLSLNPDTGVISGVLAGSGKSDAQIELTVQGFTGSLHAAFSLTVTAPLLSYSGSAASSVPIPSTTFQVGAPLRAFSIYMLDSYALTNGSYGLGTLVPAAGVAIAYRVAAGSALPNGLALNAVTGLISGTPVTVANVTTQIEAVITAGGVAQTYRAAIPFSIAAPTASITYGPEVADGLCVSSRSVPYAAVPAGGTPVTFTPALSGGQPGDTLSNFSATLGSLAYLTLDSHTGVISGTSFAPNNACGTSLGLVEITYTLTRGAYSNQQTAYVNFRQ